MNEGLMGRSDISPSSILVTSTPHMQSVVWTGSHSEELEVRKVTQLNVDQLHFTTSVTIKNIGDTTLTDIFCKSHL